MQFLKTVSYNYSFKHIKVKVKLKLVKGKFYTDKKKDTLVY